MTVPEEVLECSDPKCKNNDHIDLINAYVTSVFEAIDDSAKNTLKY